MVSRVRWLPDTTTYHLNNLILLLKTGVRQHGNHRMTPVAHVGLSKTESKSELCYYIPAGLQLGYHCILALHKVWV